MLAISAADRRVIFSSDFFFFLPKNKHMYVVQSKTNHYVLNVLEVQPFNIC